MKETKTLGKYNPLKAVASGHYDLQALRIQIGNRIVANFKLRIGQATSTKESDLDDEGKEILAKVRASYKLIAGAAADNVPRIGKFTGNEVISDYAELTLAQSYEYLIEQEEQSQKNIKQIIHKHPLWKAFGKDCCGLGELMMLVILGCVDIHKSKYPSSLWKYCGLDVGPDGEGRSRRAEHLETKEYTNKDGELAHKQGITYNPFLKTKLMGVLGPSFLKAKNTKYSPMYYDYRNRLENNQRFQDGCAGPDRLKGKKFSAKLWRHNKATRYIVKQFLIDLYVAWRTLEGLEVSKPYSEAKLGIIHIKAS
jgi:hypothetical protein